MDRLAVKGYLMASWSPASWEPSVTDGLPRADRRHGPYRRYLPDELLDRPLRVSQDVGRRATAAEREIRRLTAQSPARALEGAARFLLRSEAIASSLIEGIAPSPQQVALAELAQSEDVRGFSDQARLVANNITLMHQATHDLAGADDVSVADIVAVHATLLPDERHHGLRTVQNWIGGSNWHPLDADFVPPAPERVGPLMEDLVAYLNTSAHAPLMQAAVVHAQFETIHPFTDGNGRVGRALIHTVLTRRGLTPAAVLPISLVLSTLRDRYIQGLTAYRYDAAPTDQVATEGVNLWLVTFIDAATVAVEQARQFANDLDDVVGQWQQRVGSYRTSRGLRSAPRDDSASARLLAALPEAPILTSRTVQRLLSVAFPSARSALEELAEAGVLIRRKVERNTTGYIARDVFDLLGHTERRLASTRWDTRLAPPERPAPARPARPRR
jgi:Fic family protein